MVVGTLLKRLLLLVVLAPAAVGGWAVFGGPLVVDANGPVTVPDAAAAEHGFEQPTVEHVDVEQTVRYNGVSKRLDLSIYTTTATASDGSGMVAAVSLPAWSVGGTLSLNPLAYLPLEQVVKHVLPRLPVEAPELSKVGQSTMAVAGERTTVGEYRVHTEGGSELSLLVARTTLEGDLVVVVGAFPATADGTDVRGLMAELEHREE